MPACVFCAKDQQGVDRAAHGKVAVPHQGKNGFEESRASVDGEHPQRGLSDKRQFAPSQRTEGGEGDLHAPAQGAAFNEVFHTIKKR